MRISRPLILAIGSGVAAAYGLVLACFFLRGWWILDAGGRPLVVDFLPVHIAGALARHGQAALAYDWRHFHDLQATFIGHPFAGYLGWHYPPLFFLVAMALATLPYTPAFLLWVAATVVGFWAVIARIAGKGAGLLALALPPVLACAMVGQNGFFTAALLGAMLLALPRRPLLAGLLLASLTFKPQFGILLPFALAAGGHWRSLGVALLGTLLWVGIGYAIAPAAFIGFVHYLPQTGAAVLGEGAAGWFKLQSIYAVARLCGGGDTLGWRLQIVAILLAGGFNIWLWRRLDAPFALKATALVGGALLATPYVYFYDLPILAVPLAFLWRQRIFDRVEQVAIIALLILLAGCMIVPAPLGLGAILVVMGLAVRRAVFIWSHGLTRSLQLRGADAP